MNPRALCLLVSGFEEIEAVSPIDLLRRADVEVVIAALDSEGPVVGRCGMVLKPDAVLGELRDVGPGAFDLLLLPGGPGVASLRADGRPARLASDFAAAWGAGRMRGARAVAAICAAPLVLQDAGLLGGGRRFTSHFSTWEELPGALKTERVVEDGPIITSRGAGTAIEFGLACVRALRGEAVACDVARAIMV